ncbi:arginase family hydrolase, arginase/agmainase/formiminoglutamate hydrolase [Xenococcus sp. PCC 7305]|uniref:agmatinase family protein n=1 Tax=Xenococcus sp. PCC 7305 TaxID=102125 RepID=UPI0002ACB3B8|nr:agmatinase family protein [Xenococcus sp. PCC 7305]ELS03886.1 arginase family hydrolase, arginase/agmainase/formiminoglutamate hydrolase [Xenococcus sp. PCC 7305]
MSQQKIDKVGAGSILPGQSTFDLNNVCVRNSNFFGYPIAPEEAKVVFLPVPWDVTTSYGAGTANGPQAILEASYQLDGYDFEMPEAWGILHGTVPINPDIKAKNDRIRIIAEEVIDHLEEGGDIEDRDIQQKLLRVNQASEYLNDWVYGQSKNLLAQNKLIGLVGGDHSVPLGYLKALTEKHEEYGILQIDAHADLRPGFEGFTYSHASIMHNALQLEGITHLVQVGIRDLCEAEAQTIKRDRRITVFDDWQLKDNAYSGMNWAKQCGNIIASLPEAVYISFDIDGLAPAFCPHTGTPVPGGLDFNQAIYLMRTLFRSGKTIIGFDLCEVAPGESDEWDGNVGARILDSLATYMYFSHF